jgi:hypothetical protein
MIDQFLEESNYEVISDVLMQLKLWDTDIVILESIQLKYFIVFFNFIVCKSHNYISIFSKKLLNY